MIFIPADSWVTKEGIARRRTSVIAVMAVLIRAVVWQRKAKGRRYKRDYFPMVWQGSAWTLGILRRKRCLCAALSVCKPGTRALWFQSGYWRQF